MIKKLSLKTSIFILFFIILFLLGLNNKLKYNNITQNLKISNSVSQAKIIKLGYQGRVSTSPEYSFFVDGKKYISEIMSTSYCGDISNLNAAKIYKFEFPVVYNPSNPNENRILLKIEDYNKFNVPIPDTLAEILVEYFNCDEFRVIRQEGKQTRIVKIK